MIMGQEDNCDCVVIMSEMAAGVSDTFETMSNSYPSNRTNDQRNSAPQDRLNPAIELT